MPSASAVMVLVLHVRNVRDHEQEGSTVIARRFPLLIGRDANAAACVLDDGRVSRIHASLDLHDGQLFARDVDSSSGTVADGKRLSTAWTALGAADLPHEIRIRN